ncbi:phage head closure protein [Clostridium grantii]|uniref:Phage head-tail adaptor, putative, SPP1 family n=1 Tax=Clostridium grantii DSM 8605 TaxID=1121316 RepID=A0A1M5U8V2_9CLOT|nr:phage head closure protein [Clostridium grantii]SHH59286.1 phage head-tail adaptor, putative, SPP1 family [Clostridium grantii DSM 8605]
MSIGDLKHRITFQKFITSVNDNGFEIESWEEFKTVWASVKNLYGKEYFQAAAVQRERTVKFLIRAVPDIDETMRIYFQGKQYNITSIDNIRYENRFIEIKAMEVDGDG